MGELEATALEATAQGRHQASSLTTRLRTAKGARDLDSMFQKEWAAYQSTPFKSTSTSKQWDPSWWVTHQDQFPHIAFTARKVLCLPATSASSERLFSCAGLVSTPLRNRLKADKLEKVTLLASNDPDEPVEAVGTTR